MDTASFSGRLELVLVRHGETEANARGVFQGQGGSGLSPRGRSQAEALGRRLGLRRWAVVASSDLVRAVETAERIQALSATSPPGGPLALDAGLREVDVGTWSGKTAEGVAAAHPDEWAAWQAGVDVRRGGGETYEELAERMDSALGRITSAVDPLVASTPRVLVVSHGAAIKCWVLRAMGLPLSGAIQAFGALANTSITRVQRGEEGRWRLLQWNDVAHLEGLFE